MATGKHIIKSLPLPSSLSTCIEPPCALTIPAQMDKPKPVPSPMAFVVKKGSKILVCTSLDMPDPLSRYFDRHVLIAEPGSYADLAGTGDRLHCVQQDIDDHLLHLPFIGLQNGNLSQLHLHRDFTLIDFPAEDPDAVGDYGINVHIPRFQAGLACKIQKPFDDGAPPLGLLRDDFETLLLLRGQTLLFQEKSWRIPGCCRAECSIRGLCRRRADRGQRASRSGNNFPADVFRR